jgi:monofunctional biosynthetic peptidoglycan transglycosylase
MGAWGRRFAAVAAAGFWFLCYLYLTVPDVRPLVASNPTTTAFMERRVREARSQGRTLEPRQRWMPYARISGQLKRAVLVAEDSAFWQHEGLDLDQIRESFEYNLERGEFARGASTITQQLAKNLYLSPARTPQRKLHEVMIARRLEAVLSKRRILEIYLNVIEWGDGIFGADAAARAHFGVGAAGLGAEQAALLAAAIINPRVLDPGRPSSRLLRRQRMLMRRMGTATPPPDTGSAARAEAAAGTPATATSPAPEAGAPPEAAPPAGPPPPDPETERRDP